MREVIRAGVLGLAMLSAAGQASGQDLTVTYSAKGLERVTYNGQMVDDTDRWPEDALHIWHMKCFNLSGHARTDGEYGWGENNRGRVWDAGTRSWNYTFVWGTLRAQYRQEGDALGLTLTATNRADSGIVLDGATVYPFALHLPGLSGETQLLDGTEQPGVTLARWDGGVVAVVAPDARPEVWSGLKKHLQAV